MYQDAFISEQLNQDYCTLPPVGRVALPFGTDQSVQYHAQTLGKELTSLAIDVDVHNDNISHIFLDTIGIVGAVFEAHYKMLAAIHQPTRSDSFLYTVALPEGVVDGDVPYLSAETVGLDRETVPTGHVDEEPFLTAIQERALSGDDALSLTHLAQQRAFYHMAVRALFRLNEFKVHCNLRLVDPGSPEIVRQIRIALSFLALDLVLCPSDTRLSVHLVVSSEKVTELSDILKVPKIDQIEEDERMLFTLLRHWRLLSNSEWPFCSERKSIVGLPGSYAILDSRLTLTIVAV